MTTSLAPASTRKPSYSSRVSSWRTMAVDALHRGKAKDEGAPVLYCTLGGGEWGGATKGSPVPPSPAAAALRPLLRLPIGHCEGARGAGSRSDGRPPTSCTASVGYRRPPTLAGWKADTHTRSLPICRYTKPLVPWTQAQFPLTTTHL